MSPGNHLIPPRGVHSGIADRWRVRWTSGTVESWYYENLLVFVARSAA
jgi:hypothetical protein